MTLRITCYYSAHSAYAYLGAQRLYEICAASGVTLVHKPFTLGPAVEAQGGLPFAARTQAHVDYFFGREIERWAEWRRVEIIRHRPSHHDADYGLAGRMIVALGDSGPQVDAFSHAVLRAHWRDDADLSDPEVLARTAVLVGQDGGALIEQAGSAEIREKYAANTGQALALPVFGSPTYVVGGDLFYGQDRLEMVERALNRQFLPTSWRNPPVSRPGAK